MNIQETVQEVDCQKELVQQVVDDLLLLDKMIQDTKMSNEMYRPTNYWSVYEETFLPEIYKFGLADFRRRKNSILSSFGATDLTPGIIDIKRSALIKNGLTKKIPGWMTFLKYANSILNRALKFFPKYRLKKLLESYQISSNYGQSVGAEPLSKVETSCVGNPESVILYQGKKYTEHFFYYYLRYCYCTKFVDFNSINTIAELGSGCGKQVELLAKLYPHITFLLFDIPPQLYVCQQYLKKIFPDKVVDYKDTSDIETISSLESGKIYLFGSWKFPILRNEKIDLFWNCASFQEMEPNVVENYLSFVNASASHIYLGEKMDGKTVSTDAGRHGVLSAVTIDNYREALTSFNLEDMSPIVTTKISPMQKGYMDSFWSKKTFHAEGTEDQSLIIVPG